MRSVALLALAGALTAAACSTEVTAPPAQTPRLALAVVAGGCPAAFDLSGDVFDSGNHELILAFFEGKDVNGDFNLCSKHILAGSVDKLVIIDNRVPVQTVASCPTDFTAVAVQAGTSGDTNGNAQVCTARALDGSTVLVDDNY